MALFFCCFGNLNLLFLSPSPRERVGRKISFGYADICYAPPSTKGRRGRQFAWSAGWLAVLLSHQNKPRIQS